ncbi:hypothetical protein K6V92_02010 [Cupriavidus respiraculi]|uniref:hypothetical protein n=1 Tax=Cupriavidus respiraculi TaxID=195930 RepID=UPI001C95C71E|nr:hypothetical protein [Cupriavidus respiraculi]MBY4945398.1 hypothetical protein [Cupriavidus respiraculi]
MFARVHGDRKPSVVRTPLPPLKMDLLGAASRLSFPFIRRNADCYQGTGSGSANPGRDRQVVIRQSKRYGLDLRATTDVGINAMTCHSARFNFCPVGITFEHNARPSFLNESMRVSRRALGVPALLAAALLATPTDAVPADWERLAKDGYGAVAKTRVEGKFHGCERDQHIPLKNGMVFVCRTHEASSSRNPEVYIMEHVRTGKLKVVIDDDEYKGELRRR